MILQDLISWRGVLGPRGRLIVGTCMTVYLWFGMRSLLLAHAIIDYEQEDTAIVVGFPKENARDGSAELFHTLKTKKEFGESASSNNSIESYEHWSSQARSFWTTNGADRRVSSPVPCRSLLEGNEAATKVAIDYTNNHKRYNLEDKVFHEITQDCALFTRKRGYFMDPGSKLEEDFPIAFSILFHKHLDTVERLLRALYRPQNIYCLHLDGKSPEKIYQAALSLTKCLPNVFLTKRENIVYGGFSRLKADINCMSDVLNKSQSWKYFINLAGEEYPLKTNREMVEILRIYNGANDIEGLDKRTSKGRFSTKFEEEIHADGSTKVKNTKVKKDKPPHNITIVRGSAYGIFSRGFVDFIINDQRARDLLNWSRDTYTPDEHFWATLHHLKINPHLNTPGGYRGEPMKKPWLAGYAAWGRKDVDPCIGRHFVHGVCVFGIKDLPQLVGRRELFANKFHLNFQPLALDCLEEWLYNRTVQHTVFDAYYYKQLPFIKR